MVMANTRRSAEERRHEIVEIAIHHFAQRHLDRPGGA
jgi:hypothetical protein